MAKLLYKHVGLIECEGELSVLERKLINALLFKGFEDKNPMDWHSILWADLKLLVLYKSKNVQHMLQKMKNLTVKEIQWLVLTSSDSVGCTPCRSPFLEKYYIEGRYLYYRYPEALIQFCGKPSVYAALCISSLMQLKSPYSIALYENCARYQGLGYSNWYTFKTLKKRLGFSEDAKNYSLFKRRTLEPAIDEVNDLTHLILGLREQGRGERRKIGFTIHCKHNQVIPKESLTEQFIYQKLSEQYNCPNEVIKKGLKDYSLVDWHRLFFLVERLGPVQQKVLKRNYSILFEMMVQTDQLKQRVIKAHDTTRLMQSRHEQARRQKTLQWVNNFSACPSNELKQQISEQFKQFLGKGVLLESFVESGFSSPVIQDRLFDFFKHHPKLGQLLEESQKNNLLLYE